MDVGVERTFSPQNFSMFPGSRWIWPSGFWIYHLWYTVDIEGTWFKYTNLFTKSTGWSKKWGHYVWRLRSLHAHIFKMPEPISVIFGLLQRRYILNTSICWLHIHKIYHTRSGILKMWACKDLSLQTCGLTFFGPPCIHLNRVCCRVLHGKLSEDINGNWRNDITTH